jgi:hypothetical protein
MFVPRMTPRRSREVGARDQLRRAARTPAQRLGLRPDCPVMICTVMIAVMIVMMIVMIVWENFLFLFQGGPAWRAAARRRPGAGQISSDELP